MKKLHLQEDFKNNKLRYFQQQAFDNNKLLKKWATILTGFVAIYEVVKIQDILPGDLAIVKPKANHLCTGLYITALATYYLSIFKFSGKMTNQNYFVRYTLMLIAGLCLSFALGLTSYETTIDRIEHNHPEKWFYSLILNLDLVWMTLLIDILVPIWYLKLLIPGAYWTALIVACYSFDFEHKETLVVWIFLSVFFTSGYWGMKAYHDWRVFSDQLNIEAWDHAHKYILDKVPDAIAVITTQAKVIYSNSTFKNLCQNNIEDLSKRLTNCKKLRLDSNSQDGDAKSIRTNHVNEESQMFTFSEILQRKIFPTVKEQRGLEDYQTYTAQLIIMKENEQTSLSYEIKFGQLLEYNKVILILTDITQRDRAISLETANKYKDKLLATVSHDLRAPINGSITLIENTLEHESVPEFIKEQFLIPAQRSCKFLLHLANDILDFSQINARKLRMNFETGSLVETIRNCYQLLEMQANKKQIGFRVDLDENLPEIFTTDHNRLSQVIINLLTNAIKFTFSGSVTLSALVINDLVRIKVVDTGIGIKDQDKQKLFQEFTRIEYDQKNINTGGVGIGLVIANKLAKKLGPKQNANGISLSSIFGQGSTFEFMLEDKRQIDDDKQSALLKESCLSQSRSRLNLSFSGMTYREEDFLFPKMDEGVVPARTELRFNSRVPSAFSSKNMLLTQTVEGVHSYSPVHSKRKQFIGRVLVVDDDAINIIAFESIMKQYGICVDTAYNGKEAIDKVMQRKGSYEILPEDTDRICETPKLQLLAKDSHYQIIFMDYEMPIMNGLETTKALRQLMLDKKINNIPIIGCTGHQDKQAQEEGTASGMTDVITKPPIKQKLLEILEKHMSRSY